MHLRRADIYSAAGIDLGAVDIVAIAAVAPETVEWVEHIAAVPFGHIDCTLVAPDIGLQLNELRAQKKKQNPITFLRPF